MIKDFIGRMYWAQVLKVTCPEMTMRECLYCFNLVKSWQ